jgi:hypothetical protein
MFLGIIVYIYKESNSKHHLPHIHAIYGEYEASFDIKSGKLLEGKFPRKQTQFIKAWILLRQDELYANWKLMLKGEQPFRIEPLK